LAQIYEAEKMNFTEKGTSSGDLTKIGISAYKKNHYIGVLSPNCNQPHFRTDQIPVSDNPVLYAPIIRKDFRSKIEKFIAALPCPGGFRNTWLAYVVGDAGGKGQV